MIGKFNHVAIAVPSVEESAQKYQKILGAKISKPKILEDHGVTTIFVELKNTKLELIYETMEKLVEEGKILHIGCNNFNIDMLQKINYLQVLHHA